MDSWKALEFGRVCQVLAGYCRTPMGAAEALRLRPFANRRQADAELDRLAEIVALDAAPELGPVADVRPLLDRARTGGTLDGPELLVVSRVLSALSACRRFLDERRPALPLVGPGLEPLDGDDRLAADVVLALDDNGTVVDSASDELAGIRQELRDLRGRVVRRLETLIAGEPEHFGERPTIRHDRHVVPVRVEHRDKLPGVVHESSGTGQTLFIEPFATVEDQNRLEELRGREGEEVARILRLLSERVARLAGPVATAIELAGRLDFLLARRRFAIDYDCTRPELNERRIRVSAGRHPLLVRRKAEVVPLNLDLPEDCDVLLISGPNAGGKTVVLKTVGLFCLLAASGVFVPAARGTQLAFCRRVFADIGDDQSLDADLSSFTAHIAKVRTLLDEAGDDSLVLLDEVGGSTSPEEGAALAIAILEALNERGVRVIATSHLWTLKLYVQDHSRMLNAAMGMSDGAPTFRLTLGLPGESSGLEVARSAGLPAALLERARAHVGEGWLDLAGRLRRLQQELERAESARAEAERELAAAARLRAEYEDRAGRLQAEADRIRERRVVEQRRLLDEARREIENLVRQIRESQASRESIIRAKRTVERRAAELAAEASVQPGPAVSPVLEPGDAVESRTLRQRGRVEVADTAEPLVAFGTVRMRLPASDLVRVAEDDRPASPATVEPDVEARPPAQLNILGRTCDEALEVVDGYLAEASAVGLETVRVLHGKGTGALQRAVWSALRQDERVSGFRFAELNEGGRGVTVVDLRKEET